MCRTVLILILILLPVHFQTRGCPSTTIRHVADDAQNFEIRQGHVELFENKGDANESIKIRNK